MTEVNYKTCSLISAANPHVPFLNPIQRFTHTSRPTGFFFSIVSGQEGDDGGAVCGLPGWHAGPVCAGATAQGGGIGGQGVGGHAAGLGHCWAAAVVAQQVSGFMCGFTSGSVISVTEVLMVDRKAIGRCDVV